MDKETITKNYAELSEILEVDFLSDLGLEPVFVQVRELYEQDVKHKENILHQILQHVLKIYTLRYDQISSYSVPKNLQLHH